MRDHFAARYLRVELLPTSFCPGCGNGIVMNAFLKAVEELGYEDLKEFVFVSGIGCSSWIPNPYFKADSIHTLHGRAIPVALGLKLSRPELKVVVIAGDGDIASIGLEHLVHAARRNADLLVLMVKNKVLITPPVYSSILEGITRNTVITLARDLGYTVVERRISRGELYTCDEAFFTGTAAEITPIVEVDHRVIGNGDVGEVTDRLSNLFREVVSGHVEKYVSWITEVKPKL